MMIPHKSGVSLRFFISATVACAALLSPVEASPQAVFLGGLDGVTSPVAGTPGASVATIVAAGGTARPTVTISHDWDGPSGSPHEEFDLTIVFSATVTGFRIEDIGLENADPIDPLTGSGRRYSTRLETDVGYEGTVHIRIAEDVAFNSGDEGNLGTGYSFFADNLAPVALSAEVAGDELDVDFDEALDASFTPSRSDFSVRVTDRNGERSNERVSRVEVLGDRLKLTLADSVRADDEVELTFRNLGLRRLQDAYGNYAEGFGYELEVTNLTDPGTETPGPPRSLEAEADGFSVIELDWRAPIDEGDDDVTGYRIEASANAGATWSVLVRDTDDTGTSYTDTGLDPGTRRHYRVAAINSFGEGPYSNVARATTEIRRLPDAPTRLTATARGTSAIALSWRAPASGSGGAISGYRIEVSPTGNSRWTTLEADTDSRATSYTDTGLNPGTTRYYRISAINRAGRGDWSNVDDATTDITAPGAPTGLRAAPSGLGGRSQLLLRWTRPSSDGGSTIVGYRIEESPNGVSGWTTLVATTRSTATTYTHTGLAPSTTRHYRVAAINAEGTGSYSSVARGTTNRGPPSAPQSLGARADGPRSIALSWTVPSSNGGAAITGYRIQRRAATSSSWITVRNTTNSTAITFQDSNLQPAIAYRYRVAAINSVGASGWSLEAGTRTHADVPGAPTNLTARAVSTSRINLSWSAPRNNGGAPIVGYRIEESADGGTNWRHLRGNTGSVATTFSHTGLRPGSRRDYRISAINTAGIGIPSRVARATTEAVLAGAPRSVMARADGSTAIELSWNPPTSDGGASITGYRIEASRSRNSGWMVIRANTQSSATTYRHTGLLAGSSWYYRVAAINSKGVGPTSRVANATTDATVPGQPRTLRAAGTGPNVIELNWDVPTSSGGATITGYRIEVANTAGGPWVALVQNSGSTATSYTHTGLPPVTTRFYRVSAINSAGFGQPAGPVSATTPADVPAAPTRLTATARGTSRIDLSWTAPTNNGGSGIIGYRVEASADGGRNWSILRRNTGSRATSFSHTNLQPATTRHYRVSAINLAGIGRASNIAAATTEATEPNAPRNLAARADGTSQIDLSWVAPTSDGGATITGYRIETSDNAGASWQTLVANTRGTATRYSHTGLSPASTRHYRVSAINRIGFGRASSVASATTDATVPDAPTGLVATATAPTQIDLTWSAPAYDGGAQVSGYRVEVSENGTNWSDLLRNSGSNSTSYSHTGLLPGSRRFYRVSAINVAGTGAPSGIASAATDDPVERAGRLNTSVLPHVAAAMTSSTVSAIADRIDAVASGMGMERRVEMGGLSSMAASFSSPGAGGSGPGRRDRSGAALLFGGSSFQTATSGGSQMATWGAGEYQHLGEPGASVLDWSGNMVSAHVGADMRVAPDILAGVAASYSSGTFDFTDNTGASPVTGTYGTAMTSVNPYVAWFSGDRGNAAWATGGYGFGDVEVEDQREALRTSPTRMLTGAAGGSYQLLESGIGGVRFKAEGWAGRVMVDGGERIDSVTLDMQRAKLALEWTQGYRSPAGNEIAIVLEGGMRYDNGDGVNGTSGEVGGGLRYSNARLGLSAEGRGRLLISAREGYEEWGFGGMIQLDPATRGQGLSIRVAPSYGDAASGVNQLWDQGVSDAVRGRDMRARANLDGEIAYGVAGFQGTPFGGFYLAEGGARAFSSGLRYDLGSGIGLRIEGTRRESALGGAEHTVGIRGRLRFR